MRNLISPSLCFASWSLLTGLMLESSFRPSREAQVPKSYFLTFLDLVNIYEFLAILVILSYSTLRNKINMFFRIFDLGCTGFLTLNEATMLYKSFVIGFLRMTSQKLMSRERIEKSAKLVKTSPIN